MKKLLALIMTLAVLLSLCACGGGSADQGNAAATEATGASFMAGFGVVNITPTDSCFL